MKCDPVIRLARAEDIDAMLPRLRTKDAIDVMTATRGSVEAVMRQSLANADHAWVWEVDGVPACIFGLTMRPVVAGGAVMWLFTTDLVERHKRLFWTGSKTLREVILSRHGAIEGYCDARFLQSMQWLRRLGFRIGEPQMVAGVPFHHFEMVNHDRR